MRWLAVLGLLGGCDYLFQLDHIPPADATPDVDVLGRWSQVEAGDGNTCALDLDHHLWCWGRNLSGECGVASSASQIDSAQQVNDSAWTQISAHYRTTCGIKDDASLWCWGRNAEGQVGIGSTAVTEHETPVQIAGSWLEVSVGGTTTCGIKSDQSLWCWGANDSGQIGDGTTTSRSAPVPVTTGTQYKHVAAGGYSLFDSQAVSTCAIDLTGQLWCWGANDFGQIGGGSSGADVTLPTLSSGGPWDSISAGSAFFCGITMGKLRCWGMNQRGQVGDVSLASHFAPTPVMVNGVADDSWASVDAGVSHACARTTSHHMYCWGGSAAGQLQLETPAVAPAEWAAPPQASGNWLDVGAGDMHTCAIADDHRMWCVGGDGLGQLGDGGTSTADPVHVGDGYAIVTTGDVHTCAAPANGTTSCAGENGSGELGTGTTSDKQVLTPATGPMFTALSAGRFSTCGLFGTQAWCWGNNSNGQLGTGNTTNLSAPQFSHAAVKVSSNFAHTCVVDTGGAHALYCWGLGDNGQVGNKSKGTTSIVSPFLVPTQTWSDVATGWKFTCGIDTSASKIVRCWGDNSFGQLASGNVNENLDPGNNSLLMGVDKIYAGAYHACAIDALGKLFCWGKNSSGQLGLGMTSPQQTSPMQVNQAVWSTVALGWYNTCGIHLDGSLWCWGDNARGQLGIGTRAQKSTPTQVGTDHDWDTVSTKLDHTCATKTDGALWCWGDNSTGALGNGTAWRTSLVPVP